jgi:hypothetical protein
VIENHSGLLLCNEETVVLPRLPIDKVLKCDADKRGTSWWNYLFPGHQEDASADEKSDALVGHGNRTDCGVVDNRREQNNHEQNYTCIYGDTRGNGHARMRRLREPEGRTQENGEHKHQGQSGERPPRADPTGVMA